VIAAARSVAPTVAEWADHHDRTGSFPARSIDAIWSAGLGALTVPARSGGVGASLAASAKALEIIGAADGSTALILKWHLTHLLSAAAYWSPEWQARLYAETLDGPALIGAQRNEPELGTPARGGMPATTARPVFGEDGARSWSVSGHKLWSTGSVGLRWLAVWAVTTADDPQGQRVGLFMVPNGTPGVEIREGSWDHLGMRASVSNDIVFDDVVVPWENGVGLTSFDGAADPESAKADAAAVFVWGFALEGSLYLGIAQAARDWLVGYLNDRVPSNLGAPLATLPRFQAAVGEIELRLYAAQQLIADLVRRADELAAGADSVRHAIARSEPDLVKVAVAREVIAITEQAVSLIGNPGLSYRNPLQRYYRDALCSRVHFPQEDAVFGAAGRRALAR
jgi:alkylation response protein AidB-like acyl-CoA dehydrogenase